MKTKFFQGLLWIFSGTVILTWVTCNPPYINSIDQPETAGLNSPFEVDVSVAKYGPGGAEQILSRIGLQLPAGLSDIAGHLETTPHRLIFGIEMPLGWTVQDSITFTGDDEGFFIYSDFLSGEMTNTTPPASGYYWWVSETCETMNTANGQVFFTPVITTDNQKGNFFLTYSIGYWTDSSLFLGSSYSYDNLICCGLEDTVFVTSTANEGPGSLRAALDSVNAHGTILFNMFLPATIHLSGEIQIYKSVTIQGPPARNLVISGDNLCRVFVIPGEKEVHLANLTIMNGMASSPGGGICWNGNSQGSMTNLLIENNTAPEGGGIYFEGGESTWHLSGVTVSHNTATNYGGGIYFGSGSGHLSDVTVRHNIAGLGGGGIYGNAVLSFDSLDRCNIFSNDAWPGCDLYLTTGYSSIIFLDTFSVIQPNDYWAWPQELYGGFDILQPVIPLLDQDVYVSPIGSDSNLGITPGSPFKTISHALKMTFSDPEDPNVIHLAAGNYSPGTNDDNFPLYANSYIRLSGQGRDTSLLIAVNLLTCKNDVEFTIDGIGMSFGGISLTGSEISISDFQISLDGAIYCNNSTLSMANGTVHSIYYTTNSVIINASGASEINLTDLHVYGNAKPLLNLDNSQASLAHCLIKDNEWPSTSYNGQMINVSGNSLVELSQSTIKNNSSARAMTISGNSSVWFDSLNRSNIFKNAYPYGRDLDAQNYSGQDVIEVILDTFSVFYPTDYYAYPLDKFSFDILNGKMPQLSQNLYVSVQGSDENSGLTPGDPFRTVTRACQVYYPIDNVKDTIFLSSGTYGEGEAFPVFPSSDMTIAGAGADSTSISGGAIVLDHKANIVLKDFLITNPSGYCLDVKGTEVFLDRCDLVSSKRGINVTGPCEIKGDSALLSNNEKGIFISDASAIVKSLLILNNSRYGIDANNSYLECYNVNITGNGFSSSNYGGFRAQNSQVSVLNSVFEGNQSSTAGGALYLNSSNVLLINNSFTGNASNSAGGAMYSDNTGGLLMNNTFTGNTAATTGGAIYYYGSSSGHQMTLINNVIENNAGQHGGAIYSDAAIGSGASLTLCGTKVRKNNATGNGGGLFAAGGNINMVDCRIELNKAEAGGGIYFGGELNQLPYLSHSTIIRNSANFGGGVCLEGSGITDLVWDDLNRCNIYLNRALYSGQDLFTSDTINIYPIVLDTFTVLNPGTYFAQQIGSFEFDILHGYGEPGDIDRYVSPEGDDGNSGFSFDDPMKTITSAIFSMSLDTVLPHTIHLAEGIYSASGTGEAFPVELWERIEIIGQGPDLTILNGEHSYQLFIKHDHDIDILRNMRLEAGNCMGCGGGAISTDGTGTLELENMILDTNVATRGGAVFDNNTTLKFSNVFFTRNKANYGGAIAATYAHHDFNHVALLWNKAPMGSGGGAYLNNCLTDWKDVSFTGNKAKYGGAVRVSNSECLMSNLVLYENECSQFGSALYVSGSDLELDLMTVIGNLNTGINASYIYSNNHAHLMLRNSICWGNEPNTMNLVNSTLDVSHCDIQGGQAGINITGTLNWLEGNIDADPLIMVSGDHPCQLTAGSPCIDAGTPDTTGLNLPLWDLMGNYRMWDGDGDGDTIVDMGAYEFGSVGVGVPGSGFRVPGSGFQVEVWPNPTSGVSSFGFRISGSNEHVTLKIYDLYGQEVQTLVDEVKSPGEYTVRVDVSDLPAGVYMVRVQAGEASAVRKLVVK
jgi:predicted outer membrane repeat protein